MNRNRNRKLQIATLSVALAALVSCESTDGMRVRTTLAYGQSDLKAEHEESGISGSVDGDVGALRVEVSKQPDYIPNVEVGLRGMVGMHDVHDINQGVTIQLDTLDLGAAAVLRPYIDLSEQVRLYGEGFVGYRHVWGDLRADDLGGDDDEGGLYFGAGGGFEIGLTERSDLLLGVEWTRNILSKEGVDLDIDDFVFTAGWALSF